MSVQSCKQLGEVNAQQLCATTHDAAMEARPRKQRLAIVLSAVAALTLVSTSAFANLIYQPNAQLTGTGIGNLDTILVVHDPGGGPPDNLTESGCVARGAGVDIIGSAACQFGLQGVDEMPQTATTQLSLIPNLTNAGDLSFVVNVSETGSAGSVLLTDLYLALYNNSGTLLSTHQYVGPDLLLLEGQGQGAGTADFIFTLDAAQAAAAAAACDSAGGLSNCFVGGGVQFGFGTTDDGNELLQVVSRQNIILPPGSIPEPTTPLILGAGLVALGLSRRFTAPGSRD